MNQMRKWLAVPILAMLVLAGCGQQAGEAPKESQQAKQSAGQETTAPKVALPEKDLSEADYIANARIVYEAYKQFFDQQPNMPADTVMKEALPKVIEKAKGHVTAREVYDEALAQAAAKAGYTKEKPATKEQGEALLKEVKEKYPNAVAICNAQKVLAKIDRQDGKHVFFYEDSSISVHG